MSEQTRARFWLRVKWLTGSLLVLWLGATLGIPWFARELDALRLFGFPLGYWLTAEGALLLYLLIIAVYVVAMDRLEAGYMRDAAGEGAPGADAT